MNATQRRPRRKPGENRALLLEAGLIEFGLFGYHGASTVAIATRADVPQPHVYASFRTKQELFLACFALACTDIFVPGGSQAAVVTQRMVLQAIAVARDPGLSAALAPALDSLRTHLGEDDFCALLGTAAVSLLDGTGRGRAD